jgi:hypothetical protein
MLTKTLAAIAALSMLVGGGSALAAQPKSSTAVAGPKQPIPYSQLDTYLKASPKAQASKDWWAGSASTGMAADTSATAPAAPMSSPGMTAMPPADTAVNPPSTMAPPSLPDSPPAKATPPKPADPTMPK